MVEINSSMFDLCIASRLLLGDKSLNLILSNRKQTALQGYTAVGFLSFPNVYEKAAKEDGNA